uniref:Uncharacterized protein n=1 Tax=Anguilla anguilla TaxID=7936 RepID=A0A0E9UMX1_ANGAN
MASGGLCRVASLSGFPRPVLKPENEEIKRTARSRCRTSAVPSL